MGEEPDLETPKNGFNVSKRQRYYIFNAIISKTLSGVYSDGINLHKNPLLSEVQRWASTLTSRSNA
jgi:hypothetical protein